MLLIDFEQQVRQQIAEKILNGQKLDNAERTEAYRLITGKEPEIEVKRGRPSTIDRDYNIATEYLLEKRKGKKKPNIIRRELEKKYGLSGEANTFYAALTRGIEDWHAGATHWLEYYRQGWFRDKSEAANRLMVERMELALQVISDYRKQKNNVPKKVAE